MGFLVRDEIQPTWLDKPYLKLTTNGFGILGIAFQANIEISGFQPGHRGLFCFHLLGNVRLGHAFI